MNSTQLPAAFAPLIETMRVDGGVLVVVIGCEISSTIDHIVAAPVPCGEAPPFAPRTNGFLRMPRNGVRKATRRPNECLWIGHRSRAIIR